jgi:hypothetical protein
LLCGHMESMLKTATGLLDKNLELEMTFDQWIDAVNTGVRSRLGAEVRTEELSWDSAIWVSASGTAVASISDDEATAKLSFDQGDKLSVDFRQPAAAPELISAMIAGRLSS